MPSVKIAIDIRRMTEFGVGTYIRNVVRTLGRLDRERHLSAHRLSRQSQGKSARSVQLSYRSLGGAGALAQKLPRIPHVVKRLDCDLVHIPNYSVPRGLSCP